MSDLDHPESDHISESADFPIGPGTVKYLKTSKTMNNKDIQKFAIPNPEGRVKVISYFPESEADFLTVILFKPSHNIEYFFFR